MTSRYREFRSELARHHYAQGWQVGLAEGREESRRERALATMRAALLGLLERRLGEVPAAIAAQIEACTVIDVLTRWIVEAGSAADRVAVLAAIGPAPA